MFSVKYGLTVRILFHLISVTALVFSFCLNFILYFWDNNNSVSRSVGTQVQFFQNRDDPSLDSPRSNSSLE